MGDLNPTQRVIDVVGSIRRRRYQLPSIQRPFVWKQEQILRLLDSVMCGYPIGAVMLWKPPNDIRCRPFLEEYTSGEHALSRLPAPAEAHAYMVLDGQQRLQSLYMSFYGRYDGRCIYMRIDRMADESDDGLRYLFEFLLDNEAKADPAYVHLAELVKLGIEYVDEFVKRRLPGATDETQRIAVRIATRFISRFVIHESVLFQEVDDRLDYNDVLEVFERVNSGGTALSKSDLLFSTVKLKIPDMEERFLRMVDDLNDGGRHDFSTDFVIKTAFIVFGKKAKYDYKKLADSDFLDRLEADFDQLEKVMIALRVWLDTKALIKSSRFLRSKSALIPLVDYMMQNKRVYGPAEGDESDRMRQYLYVSFFARLYARAPDNILDQIHDLMIAAPRDSFPIGEIGGIIAKRERKGPYQFRDEYLWDLDLVLNIVDGGVLEIPQKRGWSLEHDHIFPRNQLQLRNIERDVDDVGNLRLLGKSRNISRSDTMPDGNTEFFGKADPELAILYKDAYSGLTQDAFSLFVQRRRALIRSRVTEFLGFEEKND
ncbi:MAG: DUF262 domain-containing protein [Anaerolineae bacterium]|nr:DUF262 domain-containing protein [Anaerolineae bacterium]